MHTDLWTAFFEETLSPRLSKALNSTRVEEHLREGSPIYEAFEQASAGVIFSLSPFPLNLIFYLGLRVDIAAFMFVILPAIFILFSIPMLMTIRNYFASKKSGVVKHREAYLDTALVRYTCTGPPGWKDEMLGDELSDISEEDLASTFDGEYSGMEYSYDEDEDFESEVSAEILEHAQLRR
jgi:hypothetical protein